MPDVSMDRPTFWLQFIQKDWQVVLSGGQASLARVPLYFIWESSESGDMHAKVP